MSMAPGKSFAIALSAGPGTKIRALSGNKGGPIAFHLTGANVSEPTGAEVLLPFIPAIGFLPGEKAMTTIVFDGPWKRAVLRDWL